jgi:hypothetical protein
VGGCETAFGHERERTDYQPHVARSHAVEAIHNQTAHPGGGHSSLCYLSPRKEIDDTRYSKRRFAGCSLDLHRIQFAIADQGSVQEQLIVDQAKDPPRVPESSCQSAVDRIDDFARREAAGIESERL